MPSSATVATVLIYYISATQMDGLASTAAAQNVWLMHAASTELYDGAAWNRGMLVAIQTRIELSEAKVFTGYEIAEKQEQYLRQITDSAVDTGRNGSTFVIIHGLHPRWPQTTPSYGLQYALDRGVRFLVIYGNYANDRFSGAFTCPTALPPVSEMQPYGGCNCGASFPKCSVNRRRNDRGCFTNLSSSGVRSLGLCATKTQVDTCRGYTPPTCLAQVGYEMMSGMTLLAQHICDLLPHHTPTHLFLDSPFIWLIGFMQALSVSLNETCPSRIYH